MLTTIAETCIKHKNHEPAITIGNDGIDLTAKTTSLIPVSSTITSESSSFEAAVLENLDILYVVLSFVGPKQYRFVAAIDQRFKETYLQMHQNNTETYLNASTIEHATICWNEIDHLNNSNQHALCASAAAHGNLPSFSVLAFYIL